MAIRVKTQKDYYLTEINMELPLDLSALDDLLRATGTTGRIVAVYSEGGLLGVNVEQRTKIPNAVSEQIKRLLGLGTKEL